MSDGKELLAQLDQLLAAIMQDWYTRLKAHYVTAEESEELGVEPELKLFSDPGNYRLKFARKDDLDVTYGLGAVEEDGRIRIIASVNNKSAGFDYDRFVERLKAHYWAARNEKPWTDPEIDHFAYGDLLAFEPRMGTSIALEIRKDKADIVSLFFDVRGRNTETLFRNPELLRDLVENYCLFPLQRLYAESYFE